MQILTPRFPLGQVVSTPAALDILEQSDSSARQLLAQHQSGNWGTISEDDQQVNEEALESGDRILSAYRVEGTKLWIITEADRSSTTLLLPDEY
jgi:hypothetical protein